MLPHMVLTPEEEARVAEFMDKPAPRARTLVRYSNRKIYDPSQHCYVGLKDILNLLMDGDPFRVKQSKTGVDITTSILSGIISMMSKQGVRFDHARLVMLIRDCRLAFDAQSEGQPS